MDPYYSPEKFGLTKIGEVEYSPASCEFDLLVVWRRDCDGALLYGEDSGCSCPSPFDTKGVGDLTVSTKHEIAALIQARLGEPLYEGHEPDGQREALDLIERLMREP